MKTPVRRLLPFTVAAAAVLFTGCTVVTSRENTRYSGRVVAEENLHRIQPGETTEAWIVATLGEPSRVEDVGNATRILRYESTKIKEVDAELLFIFDVGSRTELDRTVFIETREGVVARFWSESGRKRHS